jgi:hypothetical protein
MGAERLLVRFWSLARLYIGAPRARVGCDLAPPEGQISLLRRAEQSLGVLAEFIHHQDA